MNDINKNISKSVLDVYKENKISVFELEDNKHKAIEDFILFMVIVGNDFLPHIPHFDISSNVNELFENYKTVVQK